jgi:hypothetical protein
MQTARRLYVYLVSGVSLGFLLIGLRSLLEVLLDTLGLRDLVSGNADASQQLSVALALVGVGTPVWLLHWWFAERSVRADRADSGAERQSAVRAFYFAALLGLLLLFGAAAASDLISSLVSSLAPTDDYYGAGPADSIPTILVTAAAWGYHAALRRRDMGVAQLDGPAVWLPRVYLYLAAFAGLVVALVALIPLVLAAAGAVVGRPYPWTGSVGPAVVGALVWVGHKWYTDRLLADRGWRGASERAARLRLAYLVSLIVIGVGGTVALVAQGIQPLLVAALGSTSGPDLLATAVIGPLLAAVPFAVIGWWFHVRALRREATSEPSAERSALVWRLEHVAVALTGLAFAAVGSARLIGVILDSIAGADTVVVGGDAAASAIGLYLPYTLLGGAIWLIAWIQVERRRAVEPLIESRSTIRRAALLIVLAASVIAGLASVALILYRVFGFLLEAGLTGDAVSELATPTGILVVAVVGGVYHGLALRRDQALLEAEPTVPEAPIAGISLTLLGPAGEEVDAALEALRSALPEGYRLERD